MTRFFIIRHDFQNNDIYLTHQICDTLDAAQAYCLELLEGERDAGDEVLTLEWVAPTIGGTGFADAVLTACLPDEAFAIFEREV